MGQFGWLPGVCKMSPRLGFFYVRAFKALAYKRYQHVPIYLEWAPANIFRADAPKAGGPLTRLAPNAPAAQLASAPAAADIGGNAAENGAAAAAAVLPAVEDNDTSTIYVKNLAFATGDSVEFSVQALLGCGTIWVVVILCLLPSVTVHDAIVRLDRPSDHILCYFAEVGMHR